MDNIDKLPYENMEEKVKAQLLIQALGDVYQNIYFIDVSNTTVEIIKQNGYFIYNSDKKINAVQPYDRIYKSYVATRVLESDAEVVTEKLKLENVINGTASGNSYEFKYRVLTNGQEEYYVCKFLSVGEGYLLCVMQNIDNLIAAENENDKELCSIIDKMTSLNEELSEYINIISNAGYGIWHIVLKDGSKPRMQVNDKMAEILGIDRDIMTEEEIYASWYDYIVPEAIPSVQASVQEMLDGYFSENTYKWQHSAKGIVYVRCGGTSMKLSDGTTVLRGYHTEVTEIVKKEQARREELQKAKNLLEIRNNELVSQLHIIKSIARSFNCIYYVDMKDYSFVEIGAEIESISDAIGISGNAYKAIKNMCISFVADEFQENAKEFMNIDTVNERLKDRTWVSYQMCGPLHGWFEAIFIAADRDEEENCNHVIFATRDIDEVKRREEKLVYKSNTDEMTHLYNRRAYEEAIEEYKQTGIPEDLVYISIDVNGLKVVNDTLGHAAGDELIIGASQCIARCFGKYGKIFRTGGDEFIALINVSPDVLERLKLDIQDVTIGWRGRSIKELALSCGYVTRWEAEDLSIHEISVLADQRMYKAKEAYYKNKGIDRKGQKDAHMALSLLYSKILKINITDDSYQILNIGNDEDLDEVRKMKNISTWFSNFAHSDIIHSEDSAKFLEKTDLEYMRNYFRDGKKRLQVVYRKKYGDIYKQTVTEIIPANDYSEDAEVFFLYVKKIEE